MTRMKNLMTRLERLELAGPLEIVPLAAEHADELSEAGAEVASYLAFDGTAAVSAVVGINGSSCTALVRVPLTTAVRELGPEDAPKYASATQLATRIPGAAISFDQAGRVHLAFNATFGSGEPDTVVAFVQRSASIGKTARPALAGELSRLGFQTDLSRDKRLVKAAGHAVKLSPQDMQQLVGGDIVHDPTYDPRCDEYWLARVPAWMWASIGW